MKKFLINFKSIIQFFVSIIASREFAFVYCVFGTIAQTAHTYYLLDGISSLNGWWKISQSILLSFFISSSLLYFTAISDNNDNSPSGRRVVKAVTLFMWLEIVINLYYYSKHIIIDTKNYDTNNLFQLAFGVLIACIIPVTIKLYSSQIRAKEWLDLDTDTSNSKLEQTFELEKIKLEFLEKVTSVAESQNQLAEAFVKFQEEKEADLDLGMNPKEYVNTMVNTALGEKMSTINTSIEESFNKHSDLFAKQFENKLQMMVKNNTQTN